MHVKIRKRIGNPTLYNAKINYSPVYFIFVWFIDFGERSKRYYIRFGNLHDKTRLRWKVSMWIFVVSLYIYLFAMIYFLSYETGR